MFFDEPGVLWIIILMDLHLVLLIPVCIYIKKCKHYSMILYKIKIKRSKNTDSFGNRVLGSEHMSKGFCSSF